MNAAAPTSPDPSVREASESKTLTTGVIASYGAVAGPFEMLRAPALAILPALYAKDMGLAMTAISLALLLLRLSDGATDVIVGVLSDRTRSRFGRRKPWLIASVFLALPTAYGLFVPGDHADIWTFSICYFFFYLAWTMFDIPYTAWSAELATGYDDRSRLALSRTVFANVGLIVLTLVPLAPFLPSSEMNFATLHAMFWLIAVMYPLGIWFAVRRVPVGTAVASADLRFDLRGTIAAVRANRPLAMFLGIAFLSDFAVGCMSGMFFLFFDTYLGIGASFTTIFLTAVIVSTASLKAWEFIVQRGSKTRLLLLGLGGAALHGVLILVLVPGAYALPLFIGYMCLYYILAAGRDVALYGMFGDIVDYDMLKTGVNRAGQYTSAWMVLRKIAYAVSPAVAFFIAGAAGYDPASAQNDATAVLGLKAANGYLPAACMALAILLAVRYPLNKQRHGVIRRRLDQRATRAARAADA